MKSQISVVLIALLVVAVLLVMFLKENMNDTEPIEVNIGEQMESGFSKFGLQTNTAESAIDLDQVLSGGPGKDGIPALDNPSFVSIEDAEVEDEVNGILVEIEAQKRFYPFNILVWHEIVNDLIGNTHFSVTFCPLCGSAIVFNREVGGEVLSFGVSGLLYESNLLMYDKDTESLWSQALGKAVVGNFTGTQLEFMEMRRITFAELKDNHPDSFVMSRDTGFSRNYDLDPYSGYDSDEDTLFLVSVSDTRLPAKEIMYVIPDGEVSIAFREKDVEGRAELELNSKKYEALKGDDGISVTIDGTPSPGYYEMWFSWATHHQEDGYLWKIK